MAENNVILFAECNRFSKEFQIRNRRRRVVGIIQKHQFCLLGHIGRNCSKVRQEFILSRQRHIVGNAVGKHRPQFIYRIRRVRNQSVIARIDEGQKDMRNAFLGADQGHHFSRRIQVRVKTFFIPGADCGPKFQRPFIIRITMIFGGPHGFAHLFYNLRRRRLIGIADPETDNVNPAFDCFPLLFVNGCK